MNYKLIISDVDGTIVGKDERMTPAVSSALKRWINTGRFFTIASGKQYLLFKNELQELDLKTPVIVRGGAQIVDPISEKVLYEKLMDKDTVESFVALMLEHRFGLIVEEENVFYSNYQHRYVNNKNIQSLNLDIFTPRDIPKIVVSLKEKDLDEAEILRHEVVKRYPQLHIVKSYSPLGKAWDVTAASATKHLAVLELLKIINISPEETVGVGDGYNDFPLLEACGLKVAMENAPEDLKAIADVIVPDYKHDGVADLINKLLES